MASSDYLTVKTLISRHATMEGANNNNITSTKDQKLPNFSPAITPRTRRKIEEATENLHPLEQIAFCRADVRSCGSLHDLLENFHQAFSEDQLWAIVFQFMTLYRQAIVSNGGGGGQQRAVSRASSSGQSSSHNDSSCSSTSSSTTTTKSNNISVRRKSKSASGGVANKIKQHHKNQKKVVRNQSSDSDSDESCNSTSSDVEASDNSDIISELMLADGEQQQGKKSVRVGGKCNKVSAVCRKGEEGAGGSSSSDEGDDRLVNDNEKPKSRLDHVDYLNVPTSLRNFHIHKDGSVHVSYADEEPSAMRATSQKQILMKLGLIFYRTMDYHLLADEECLMSPQLEELMCLMISEDDYDEGIEGDLDTKEMDHILQICHNRIKTYCPESHYKAVCRALVAEVGDLKLFLQKISDGETEQLRLSVDAQASQQELDGLYLNDWACFWVQVLDELRSGIRLKKSNYTRAPLEYELTPYEMLMDDIRSKNYRLRKVLVNGKIPQRVKNDAHAIILEFIRSRPPLKKASERKLAPKVVTVCPREELLNSIRRGKELKSVLSLSPESSEPKEPPKSPPSMTVALSPEYEPQRTLMLNQ